LKPFIPVIATIFPSLLGAIFLMCFPLAALAQPNGSEKRPRPLEVIDLNPELPYVVYWLSTRSNDWVIVQKSGEVLENPSPTLLSNVLLAVRMRALSNLRIAAESAHVNRTMQSPSYLYGPWYPSGPDMRSITAALLLRSIHLESDRTTLQSLLTNANFVPIYDDIGINRWSPKLSLIAPLRQLSDKITHFWDSEAWGIPAVTNYVLGQLEGVVNLRAADSVADMELEVTGLATSGADRFSLKQSLLRQIVPSCDWFNSAGARRQPGPDKVTIILYGLLPRTYEINVVVRTTFAGNKKRTDRYQGVAKPDPGVRKSVVFLRR
jgi:hypothetical protein